MAFNKTLSIRRKEKDVFKLRSSNYEVEETEQASTYHVQFNGNYWTSQGRRGHRMRRDDGASTSTCLKSTLTRVPLWDFSTKFTTPTLTTGICVIIKLRHGVSGCDKPDLDADVRIGQYF